MKGKKKRRMREGKEEALLNNIPTPLYILIVMDLTSSLPYTHVSE